MKKLFFLLLILFLSHHVNAQLAVKDITKIMKYLSTPINKPDTGLVRALDTLSAHGDILVSKQWDTGQTTFDLGFENNLDTVTRETVHLSSSEAKGEIIYSMTVQTSSFTQFQAWGKALGSDPTIIVAAPDVNKLDHKIYNSFAKAKSNIKSYDLSYSVSVDPKTGKHQNRYTLSYIYHYVPKPPKGN